MDKYEHSTRQYKTTDTSPELRKARCDSDNQHFTSIQITRLLELIRGGTKKRGRL